MWRLLRGRKRQSTAELRQASNTGDQAGREARTPRRSESTPKPAELTAGVRTSSEAVGLCLDAGQTHVLDNIDELPELPTGIYLHGDVGRGKSWLGDRLFEQFPEPKRRVHCHEFLADINSAIARRAAYFAEVGPGSAATAGNDGHDLRSTAELIDSVVDGYDYLMFDDFHVHDVADGELLHKAIARLHANGTFMLLTSNYAPDDLMPSPLFHESFLPTIRAIKNQCVVLEIPAGPERRQSLTHRSGFSRGTWTIVDRATAKLPTSPGSARLDAHPRETTFADLCQQPRSAADYFAMAQTTDQLLLTEVPNPAEIDTEAFQRLAFLIDALVDQDVRLDVRCSVSRDEFRTAQNLPRDADRFLSRLAMLADT